MGCFGFLHAAWSPCPKCLFSQSNSFVCFISLCCKKIIFSLKKRELSSFLFVKTKTTGLLCISVFPLRTYVRNCFEVPLLGMSAL